MMINVIFYFEDNLFTLTMFWTTSIYLGSFFGQHGYNAIFGYGHVIFC
jgi:hypothetical protein